MLCAGEPGITLVNWPAVWPVKEFWPIIFPPPLDFAWRVASTEPHKRKSIVVRIDFRQDNDEFSAFAECGFELNTSVVFLNRLETH